MTGLVELVVEEPRWLEVLPDLQAVADRAAAVGLREAGFDPTVCEIALLACDDARIAALNERFRSRMGPTNVLSWPAFDPGGAKAGLAPRPPARLREGAALALGDLAIGFQTVTREAEARGVGLNSHVIHLILHGTLHLLGYDHETEADAGAMEATETRLLAGLGISDPYALVEHNAARSASDR